MRKTISTILKLLLFLVLIMNSINICAQNKISLRDAINMAKEKNLYIKTYRYNILRKKADITTAGLRPNPVFNQQSLFLMDRRYIDAIAPNQNIITSPYARQTWFQLTKQYQVGGQRKAKINYFMKEAVFSEKDAEEFTYNIVLQTAQKWLDVWYAERNLANIRLAKKNIDSLVTINKIRLDKLVISRSEYLRNKIVADQYNTLLKSAEQTYFSENLRLKFLINTSDDIYIDVDSDFLYIDISGNRDTLINYAIRNRPDLIADKAAYETSIANVNMHEKMAHPIPEFGLVYNPQNIQPYAGWYFQMPLPVFNQNQGEIQKAKVLKQQTQSQIATTVSLIENEVSYSMGEYEVSRANIERYKEILANAEEVLNTVRYSYLRGGTTFLDFLQAQSAWYQTQKDYVNATYIYRKNYIQLLNVTGLIKQ